MLSNKLVISLFLAKASAQVTVADIINGSTSADTTAAESITTEASSLLACQVDDKSACTEGMQCSQFQEVDTAADAQTTQCVHTDVCGSLGKRNGKAFSIVCMEEDDMDLPEQVDPAALLANVELLVNAYAGDPTWADVQNIKIPSRDDYMTGWWIRGEDTGTVDEGNLVAGLWSETDKKTNNVCQANSGCEESECCVNWPNLANKRCKDKTLAGELQTILPFKPFTPTCAANSNAPPQSGEKYVADEAASKAAEDLKEFRDGIETDAKAKANYDDMTDEEKATFDEKRAARTAIYTDLEAKLKLEAGYDTEDCDQDCKNVFMDEWIKWDKAVFEQCKTDIQSIECRDFVKIKEAEEKARATDGFYSLSAEDRETFEAGREEARASTKATLTAAFIKDNAPAAGEEGSDCGTGPDKCTTETHCCGTATPKGNAAGVTTDQIETICAVESTGEYTDSLGREYKHECNGAKALLASATAVLAAVLLM